MQNAIVERPRLNLQTLAQDTNTRESIFLEMHPGINVRPIDLYVGRRDELFSFDREFLHALYDIVRFEDSQFDGKPDGVEDDEPRRYTVLYTADEIATSQRSYISTLKGFAQEDGVVFACPLHGSATIMDRLLASGVAKSNIFPAHISGTEETFTGTAQITGDLPDELKIPQNTVVFADDVLDSAVTAVQLAFKRHDYRMKGTGAMAGYSFSEPLAGLPERMRQSRKGKLKPKADSQVWVEVAKLLVEEKMVVATFTMKNHSLRKALTELIDSGEVKNELWLNMQGKTLAKTIKVRSKDWIMGCQGEWRYPMLDTKINGVKQSDEGIGLLDYIPAGYQGVARRLGLDKLYLRAGAGIRQMVVFNPDSEPNAYASLVEELAGYVTQYLEYQYPQPEALEQGTASGVVVYAAG